MDPRKKIESKGEPAMFTFACLLAVMGIAKKRKYISFGLPVT